jgi:hypothetical protein
MLAIRPRPTASPLLLAVLVEPPAALETIAELLATDVTHAIAVLVHGTHWGGLSILRTLGQRHADDGHEAQYEHERNTHKRIPLFHSYSSLVSDRPAGDRLI